MESVSRGGGGGLAPLISPFCGLFSVEIPEKETPWVSGSWHAKNIPNYFWLSVFYLTVTLTELDS